MMIQTLSFRPRLDLRGWYRGLASVSLVVSLMLTGFVGCDRKAPGAPPSDPNGLEHAGHTEESKKPLYQCPMHPSYTSDKPGECPICGMSLVPVEESGAENNPPSTVPGRVTVRIAPERQQIIGVKIEAAAVRLLTRKVRAVGTIAYDPELYQAEKEFIEAVTTRDTVGGSSGTQSLVESATIRLRQLGLNDDMIDALTQSRKASLNLLLPEDTMWVYAQVYEYELNWVKTGQPVSVTSLALPGEVFRGTLRAVDPVVNPETRTVRIRAEVKNPGKKLKPNNYANVEIEAAVGKGLTIPTGAVIDSGDRTIVFVDLGEGRFEPRQIQTGLHLEDGVQVLSGLKAGERVVTSANFLIDSESSLKAAVEQMGGGSTGHQGHGQ